MQSLFVNYCLIRLCFYIENAYLLKEYEIWSHRFELQANFAFFWKTHTLLPLLIEQCTNLPKQTERDDDTDINSFRTVNWTFSDFLILRSRFIPVYHLTLSLTRTS